MTTYAQLSARLKNFLRGWLLVLGLKERLVECATVCVKSVVILQVIPTYNYWPPQCFSSSGITEKYMCLEVCESKTVSHHSDICENYLCVSTYSELLRFDFRCPSIRYKFLYPVNSLLMYFILNFAPKKINTLKFDA